MHGYGNSSEANYYSFSYHQIEYGKTYKYRLTDVDTDGVRKIHNKTIQKISIHLSDIDTADKYDVVNVYPNPFNPITKIRYTLNKPSSVKIRIYNIAGDCVGEIINSNMRSQGELKWNGSGLSAGVYIIHFEADGYKAIKQSLLLK